MMQQHSSSTTACEGDAKSGKGAETARLRWNAMYVCVHALRARRVVA